MDFSEGGKAEDDAVNGCIASKKREEQGPDIEGGRKWPSLVDGLPLYSLESGQKRLVDEDADSHRNGREVAESEDPWSRVILEIWAGGRDPIGPPAAKDLFEILGISTNLQACLAWSERDLGGRGQLIDE
jgi:hypothetical protein